MTEVVSATIAADRSQPVLSARDVTKTFRVAGGHVTAVDSVSVDFHAGKVLAVVGFMLVVVATPPRSSVRRANTSASAVTSTRRGSGALLGM